MNKTTYSVKSSILRSFEIITFSTAYKRISSDNLCNIGNFILSTFKVGKLIINESMEDRREIKPINRLERETPIR